MRILRFLKSRIRRLKRRVLSTRIVDRVRPQWSPIGDWSSLRDCHGRPDSASLMALYRLIGNREEPGLRMGPMKVM